MSRNSFTPSQFLRLFTKVISIFITTSVVAMFVIENAMALELTLDVGKGSYVRGEPVYGTVRLANDTGEVVKVFPDLTLEAQTVEIEIKDPVGESRIFVPLAIEDIDVQRVSLDPGAALTETFPIFYGGQGWTFDAVGTYELTARYRLDGGNEVRHVVSEPVRITVIDGGPASRLLLESVKDTREAGRFLLWQAGDHLRRGIALLKELIERYPNTPLADYAELAFAESLSRDFRDYSIGRVRQADCDRALERFGKVREDVPPAYLRVQKQLSEARCLIKTGRQQEAAQRVSTAKKLAASRPDMLRLFEAASLLEPTMKTLY